MSDRPKGFILPPPLPVPANVAPIQTVTTPSPALDGSFAVLQDKLRTAVRARVAAERARDKAIAELAAEREKHAATKMQLQTLQQLMQELRRLYAERNSLK